MKLFTVRPALQEFMNKPGSEPQGFNLYFAGSINPNFEDDLRDKGANRLASQIWDRNVVEGWIEGRDNGTCKGKLLVDSGAYSAHTKDTEIDVEEYCEYLNSIDNYVDLFAQVDKIPGKFRQPKTKEELELAPELSWQNYLNMRLQLNSPKKLLPIFHQGEDYKWLTNILEWEHPRTKEKVEYMGISPANDQPMKEKIKFIDKCFEIIKKSPNPDIKTHAFGMTSLNVLEMYPFTSADSTSWLLNGANGSIMTKYGSVLVSEKSLNSPSHIRKMPKAAQQEIQKYVESKGYTMDQLSTDYVYRIKLNIDYLLEWAKNYRYNPSSVRRRTLF